MSSKSSPFPSATRSDLLMVFPEELTIIGLDTPHGPEHPLYDERIFLPLDEKMIANISFYGVQEAVVAQRTSDGPNPVVDGRRRVIHTREVNKRRRAAGEELMKVPVILKKIGDDIAMGLGVSLNEIRKDDSMSVKAAKAKRLHEQYNRSPAEIAVMFGVSQVSVYSWLKLSDAAPEVMEAVEAGRLSASAASKLAALPVAEQKVALSDLEEAAKVKDGNNNKGKVAAKDVAQRAKASKNDDAPLAVPGKRQLRKIVDEGKEAGLPEEFIMGIRFALGELRADRVKGLTKLLGTNAMGKVLFQAGDED